MIPLHTRGPESIVEGVRATGLPLDRLLLGVGSPNPEALKRVRTGVATCAPRSRRALIVAALGPEMCRLAGEVADGVLLNWLTPEHARVSADVVRAGAATAAERPTPKIFAYVRLAIGEAGRAKVAEEGDRYAGIPAYRANFERMGVKPVTRPSPWRRPRPSRRRSPAGEAWSTKSCCARSPGRTRSTRTWCYSAPPTV